jgi:hypothetical protein
VLTSAHFWRIDRPLFLLSCDICVFDISWSISSEFISSSGVLALCLV